MSKPWNNLTMGLTTYIYLLKINQKEGQSTLSNTHLWLVEISGPELSSSFHVQNGKNLPNLNWSYDGIHKSI